MINFGSWSKQQVAELFTKNAYCLMRDYMKEFVTELDTGQWDEGYYPIDWEENRRSISSIIKGEHYVELHCFGHAIMQLKRILRAVEIGKFEALDVIVKWHAHDQKIKNLMLDIKAFIFVFDKRLTIGKVTSRPSFKFDSKEIINVNTWKGAYKSVYWGQLTELREEWQIKLGLDEDYDDAKGNNCEYEYIAPAFAPEAYKFFFNSHVSFKKLLEHYDGMTGRLQEGHDMEMLI